ncbi:kinase-like protein [Rickenella mellea]|uniref:Kinase-like protein n=1 Tax=Rickenella mellea TaxID=50990 RepID=A0A4Y7PVI8_9AGAM|nr:kinase-like protein [Rickenella mellea]
MRGDCALATLPLTGMSFNFERKASLRALEGKFLHAILKQIYTESVLSQLEEHWCSMITPCIKARLFLADFMSLRLVSHAWNGVWKSLFSTSLYFRDRRPYTDPPRPPYTGQTIQLDDGIKLRLCENRDPRRNRVWYQCIAGRYRVQHAAQSEYNVSVYFARDHGGPLGCEDCSEVAIKVFYCELEDIDEYTREKEKYEKLSKEPMKGIPEISWNGKSGDKYVFAMTRLGSTLQELHDRAPDKKLNDRLLLHIAIQLMDRYKDLHNRQIIHNGVKPGNIAICPPDTTTGTPDRAMIYIFDFGFSQILMDEPQEERVAANGMYASVMTLWSARQSQRDDLESLCYLFSYLFHGTLPWNDDRHCSVDIRHIKMKMRKCDLFAGMDPAFGEFWDSVKLLARGEVPDYDGMKERFCKSWKEKGYDGEPGTVDWQVMWDELVEADKVRKAEEEAKRNSEEAKEAAKRAKKYAKKKAAKKKAAALKKTAAGATEQTVTTKVDSKASVEDEMNIDGEATDGNAPKATAQDNGKDGDSNMGSDGEAGIDERSDEERGTHRMDTKDTKDLEKVAQDAKALLDKSPADTQATDHAMNLDNGPASVTVSDEDATQNTSVGRKVDIGNTEGTVDGAILNGATAEDTTLINVSPPMPADNGADGTTKDWDAAGLDKSPSIDSSSESSGAMQMTYPGNADATNGETDSKTLATDKEGTKEPCASVKNDLGGESGDVVVLVVDAMVVVEDSPNASDAKVDIKDNSSINGTLGCDHGQQPPMQCATEAEGWVEALVDNGSMAVVVCG